MSFRRRLLSSLFDTVDRTDFDAKSAQCAAPVVDVIIGAIGDDGIFRADETAAIT